MKRAVILVLDSLGIGGAPDAADFADSGADTLGHIAEACAAGNCDISGQRSGLLTLPHLSRLGLGLAAAGSSGRIPPGLETDDAEGAYGHAVEISRGKDTPSGHWEMAGVPVTFDWGYFPTAEPCFPQWLTHALIERGELPGVLGNRHASGTEIIKELGEEHLRSGKPIVYTSADSVFQIAAHEETFGLERLYRLCLLARELVDALNIGRVIARPFIGQSSTDFRRSANRRDYSVPPPARTLLDRLVASGGRVVSVGKVADIFAHRGISQTVKADGNAALFDATLDALNQAGDQTLIFTNFVDFDMLYGHRRDIAGYADALEHFDQRLPELRKVLRPGDLVVITADHGNDPTWPGSDHTREQVPVLCFGPDIAAGDIGRRGSLADIGQTIARHLGLADLDYGIAFR
jgi:phosphopentomutase